MNSASLRGLRNVLFLSASVLLLAQSPPEATRVLYVADPARGEPAAIPPYLSIVKVPMSDFVQGQRNASYYLQVSNAIGSATTSGTVTVTEVPSASLTLQSMRGPGWQCSGDTCTRSDALPGD